MSITITGSISQVAIESLGRRRVTQFGQLDQMQCVFFGPRNSLNNFPINSAHPEFPLMFCTGAQGTAIPGDLIQIDANYEGKMLTSGQASYVTYPVTIENNVQGSRDFTLFMMVGVYTGVIFVAPAGGGPAPAQYGTLYDIFTQTQTVRYIGSQCSVHYQSYPRPTKLHYSSLGLGRVKWTVLSSYKGQSQLVAHGVAQGSAYFNQLVSQYMVQVPPLYAANLGFDIQQRGLWYDCTEIYGPTF